MLNKNVKVYVVYWYEDGFLYDERVPAISRDQAIIKAQDKHPEGKDFDAEYFDA